jgi:cytoskeletal protein CcmA (bactofilin family)
VRILSIQPSQGGILALFGRVELASPNSDSPAGQPGAVSKTVVGVGTRFVGELSGDEDVLVDGRFEGKIHVQRTVSIGPTAELEADVQARHVIVGGRVKGQILAEERAELMSSAVVHGSVQAPKIVIAEGARLEGSVAMASSDSTEDEPIRKD